MPKNVLNNQQEQDNNNIIINDDEQEIVNEPSKPEEPKIVTGIDMARLKKGYDAVVARHGGKLDMDRLGEELLEKPNEKCSGFEKLVKFFRQLEEGYSSALASEWRERLELNQLGRNKMLDKNLLGRIPLHMKAEAEDLTALLTDEEIKGYFEKAGQTDLLEDVRKLTNFVPTVGAVPVPEPEPEPVKAPEQKTEQKKGPENGPEKGPEKGPEQGPEKGPEKEPENGPEKGPELEEIDTSVKKPEEPPKPELKQKEPPQPEKKPAAGTAGGYVPRGYDIEQLIEKGEYIPPLDPKADDVIQESQLLHPMERDNYLNIVHTLGKKGVTLEANTLTTRQLADHISRVFELKKDSNGKTALDKLLDKELLEKGKLKGPSLGLMSMICQVPIMYKDQTDLAQLNETMRTKRQEPEKAVPERQEVEFLTFEPTLDALKNLLQKQGVTDDQIRLGSTVTVPGASTKYSRMIDAANGLAWKMRKYDHSGEYYNEVAKLRESIGAYIEGKEKVRATEYGRQHFDVAMNLLAVCNTIQPGCGVFLASEVNRKRGVRDKNSPDYVDLNNYGEERITGRALPRKEYLDTLKKEINDLGNQFHEANRGNDNERAAQLRAEHWKKQLEVHLVESDPIIKAHPNALVNRDIPKAYAETLYNDENLRKVLESDHLRRDANLRRDYIAEYMKVNGPKMTRDGYKEGMAPEYPNFTVKGTLFTANELKNNTPARDAASRRPVQNERLIDAPQSRSNSQR